MAASISWICIAAWWKRSSGSAKVVTCTVWCKEPCAWTRAPCPDLASCSTGAYALIALAALPRRTAGAERRTSKMQMAGRETRRKNFSSCATTKRSFQRCKSWRCPVPATLGEFTRCGRWRGLNLLDAAPPVRKILICRLHIAAVRSSELRCSNTGMRRSRSRSRRSAQDRQPEVVCRRRSPQGVGGSGQDPSRSAD